MQLVMKFYIFGVLLSGCTGGAAPIPDVTTAMTNYQRKVSTGQDLAQLSSGDIATSSMPKTGAATYSGIAAFSTKSIDSGSTTRNPDLVSSVNLNANFNTNKISGTFTDFVSSQNANLTGTASLTNGTVSGNQFSGGFSGSLSGPNGNQNLSGNLLGGFFGDSATAANGEIFGTLTNPAQAVPLYGIIYSRQSQ